MRRTVLVVVLAALRWLLRKAMGEVRRTYDDTLLWAGFNVFGLPALEPAEGAATCPPAKVTP